MSRSDLEDNDYVPAVLRPPQREAWVGRMRYIVVPVIAVLAIAAAIYVLDDSRGGSDASLQIGASSAVSVTASSRVSGAAPRVGYTAPDFSLASMTDGKPVKLSDFRGKTVFLNFFATWCPPCRAEMPDIVSTYHEHQDKGVVVLGVDMQEDAGIVASYANSAGMTFPIVLDRSGDVSALYRITAIPTSFFIDKDGVVRDMQIGAMSKTLMRDRLKKAL